MIQTTPINDTTSSNINVGGVSEIQAEMYWLVNSPQAGRKIVQPWIVCNSTKCYKIQNATKRVRCTHWDLVPSQHKDGLFRYWDSHHKDEMVMRLSYLYNGNPYIWIMGISIPCILYCTLHWDGHMQYNDFLLQQCSIKLTYCGWDQMATILQTAFLISFSCMTNDCVLFQISQKFLGIGPVCNMPALVQIMAWHQTDCKPLSKPTLA